MHPSKRMQIAKMRKCKNAFQIFFSSIALNASKLKINRQYDFFFTGWT
jgi:hypothetical protein